MIGHICSPPLYEYTHEGRTWFFECGYMTGPWPLKKDGELFKRRGDRFWGAIDAWMDEPDPEAFRVGGGCQHFSTEDT